MPTQPTDGNARRRALEIYEVEQAFAIADEKMAADETATPAERAAWEAKKAEKDAVVATMMRRMGVGGNA
jgi:hypothetical protein